MAHFIKLHPRITAGVWFLMFGLLPPSLWFLPSIVKRHDLQSLFLFVLLPAMTAFVAGATWGFRILDLHLGRTQLLAFLHGIIVAIIAFLIWVPSFAALFPLIETEGKVTNIIAFAVGVFYVGLLATGWALGLLGGLGGWILYVITRKVALEEAGTQ